MKKLSADTEQKLMRCIEQASSAIDGGCDPSEGIAKAAMDCGVRPAEVHLVVHAYNTGRTTRQREENDDLLTKAADFPLADTERVLQIMYPDRVKTAAAVQRDTSPHPVYNMSPRPFLERRAAREKAAAAVDWGTIAGQKVTAPEPYPRDKQAAEKRALGNVDRARKSMEESRRKAAAAFDQMGQHFVDLTTYFRRPDATPMPVVKEAVILLHGDTGEKIFDELVKVTPGLTKLSNHRLGSSLLLPGRASFPRVDDIDCTQEPFPKVAALVGAIDTYKQEKAAFDQATAAHDRTKAAELSPFAPPAVSPSILEDHSSDDGEKRAFLNPLQALTSGAVLTNTMARVNQAAKGDPQKEIQKQMMQLEDPVHENRLRMINTQAMLQDFMVNDPVISGYDPDEVSNAYNDIVQLAPRSSDQRLLMQQLLRKQLQQGQLDSFEMDQLLGMDEKLRKREAPDALLKGVGADGSVL